MDRTTLSLDETKHIYALRWNLETFLGFVKTELELGSFTGKTTFSIMQEFFAVMTIANICLCIINDADQAIKAKHDSTKREYERQANRRRCVGQTKYQAVDKSCLGLYLLTFYLTSQRDFVKKFSVDGKMAFYILFFFFKLETFRS